MSDALRTARNFSPAEGATADSSDTKPVRASEQLDWDALAGYAREKLAAELGGQFDPTVPMTVEQFPGGHSNLTYLLRFGHQEFVMRRPPFGPVPLKAHDMARECRILAAVHPVFPLAPQPYLLCEDASVIGSAFYIMERRHGLVVRYDEQPELNSLAVWLAERLPLNASRPALLHGDFKLDNVMLDALDVGRMVAVFDWEMSAVGDPLVDLGILLAYWIHTVPVSQRDALTSVTSRPGWFTRAEMLERYAARTGNDLTKIEFYEVFAVFKLAVVLQQIFYRYHRGQTDDARFARLDERVTWLERIATALAGKA